MGTCKSSSVLNSTEVFPRSRASWRLACEVRALARVPRVAVRPLVIRRIEKSPPAHLEKRECAAVKFCSRSSIALTNGVLSAGLAVPSAKFQLEALAMTRDVNSGKRVSGDSNGKQKRLRFQFAKSGISGFGQIRAPATDALQRVETPRCLAADICSAFIQKPHSRDP